MSKKAVASPPRRRVNAVSSDADAIMRAAAAARNAPSSMPIASRVPPPPRGALGLRLAAAGDATLSAILAFSGRCSSWWWWSLPSLSSYA